MRVTRVKSDIPEAFEPRAVEVVIESPLHLAALKAHATYFGSYDYHSCSNITPMEAEILATLIEDIHYEASK